MKLIPSMFAAAAALILLTGVSTPSVAKDRDNNPPGRAGGPGTNWENPPGPRGGPGSSPDRYYRHKGTRYAFAPNHHGYYFNAHFGYWHPTYGFWNQKARCWLDNDNNPPGPVGGRGTNWENPPGMRGGPGASPDRYGRCR
ncbi:MAG: hypothetical protein CFE32_09280 [Alphaproteobacteria bacterium PA3]|nr:MAG: hypothetical protein CFE32_09280 [Alphaproteobacteria bacterium PA3]